MAKRSKSNKPAVVRRDGGLCVTFANAESAKRRSFTTFAELLAWGHRNGTVSGGDLERLERAAAERPQDAEAVLRRALELRACCRRTLRGLSRRRAPSDADFELIHAELVAARSAERWVRTDVGCRWVVGDRGGDDMDRVLWPVALSLAEVLSSKYRFQVRECAGEGCDLLFVDRTPGSPRKWCSMNSCGSKVGSRRDYQRRVKPYRKRVKQKAAAASAERVRKLNEEREREAARKRTAPGGKHPGAA